LDSNINYDQFCDFYRSEDVCIQTLFDKRWPDGFRCPRCGNSGHSTIRTRRLPLYECRTCRHQTSPIVGTIFEGSRTPLRTWFKALYLHSLPHGISAQRLSTMLNLTYKTAWLICHKIRHAMTEADAGELLTGVVHVNYGVYGRPYNPTVFRHPQEQALLAGASVDRDQKIVRLKIKQVPEHYLTNERYIRSAGGHDFVNRHVDRECASVSLVIQQFSRQRYLPLGNAVRSATNWINYTFNGIGPKHLQAYLDQFCFNWIHRDRPFVFIELLRLCLAATPLAYPILIRRHNPAPRHKRIYFELLKTAS